MRLAELSLEQVDRLIVARLDGEIDMSNARDLGMVIADRVPNDALALVIDLSDVDYVDSAGIRVLFDLRNSLRVRGQELRLVVPRGREIFEALRIAFVPGIVPVFDTVAAATHRIPDKRKDGD